MRRITKVKYDGERVQVAYEVIHGNGTVDRYTLDCEQEPEPSFTDALQKLVAHVVDLCEFAREYAFGLKTRGVTYTYGGKGGDVMGAVVTCLKTLQAVPSPLVVNTPHQTEAPLSEDGDPSICMTLEYAESLRIVQSEAARYVDGARAQMDLFMAETPAAAQGPEPAPATEGTEAQEPAPAPADPTGLKDVAEAEAEQAERQESSRRRLRRRAGAGT